VGNMVMITVRKGKPELRKKGEHEGGCCAAV
jgi:ribosomal protein L14